MTSIAGSPAGYLEIRVTWNPVTRRHQVQVEDTLLDFPPEVTAQDAITLFLTEQAQASPARAVRAHIEIQDQQPWNIRVDADGTVTPLTTSGGAPAQNSTGPATGSPVNSTSRGSTAAPPPRPQAPRSPRPATDPAAPRGAAEELLAQARGEEEWEGAPQDDEPDRTRRIRTPSRLANLMKSESRGAAAVESAGWRRWLPLISVVVAALIVIASVTTILVKLGSDGSSGIVMQRDNLTLSQPPPAEWSSTPQWASPALLEDAGRVLVVDHSQVAMVTADRHVVLVDAPSGDTVWAQPLPEGKVVPELSKTTIDGTPVIALQVGQQLMWWQTASGDASSVALPDGATVQFLGQSPLVVLSQASVGVISGGQVQSMNTPQGVQVGDGRAMAARADGTVTMGSAQGWWHLRAGQDPGAPQPWETSSTTPLTPQVVTYLGSHLLTIVSDEKTARVMVYTDRPTDVRFAFGGPLTLPSSASGQVEMQWVPSPSRSWGILGSTLVDLHAAQVRGLGDWTTQTIAADRALGTVGGQSSVVGPDISMGALAQGEGFPEDLVDLGDGKIGALMRASQDGTKIVFLLPPGQGA